MKTGKCTVTALMSITLAGYAALGAATQPEDLDWQAEILKDVFVNEGSEGSNAFPMGIQGDSIYFSANTRIHGHELWKTDGTAEGTWMVKDINPGPDSSIRLEFTWDMKRTAAIGDTFYFCADDGVHGDELWKTDGTDEGTVLVRDLTENGDQSLPNYLTRVGDSLYFRTAKSIYGEAVWKTDGTEAGTILIKELGQTYSSPIAFLDFDDRVVFSVSNLSYSSLWSSDGSQAGTFRFPEKSGFGQTMLVNHGRLGSRVYYNGVRAPDDMAADIGHELWSTDGTLEGTNLLKEINPGFDWSRPSGFAELEGSLYFFATDPTNGYSLWKTDGTSEGTVAVTTVGNSGFEATESLVRVNDALYFTLAEGPTGAELWKTDGTADGTHLLKDIYPGETSSEPKYLVENAGKLYFMATGLNLGTELWTSDGTEEGTVLVRDINPGFLDGLSRHSGAPILSLGNNLYFHADDGKTGRELWRSDGTEEGTYRVLDILGETSPSNPRSLVDVGGTLYLQLREGDPTYRIWKSSGTPESTVPVVEASPSSLAKPARNFIAVGNNTFFSFDNGITGEELWITDGTPAGSRLVKDVYTGPESGLGHPPAYVKHGPVFANLDGTLIFAANGSAEIGQELWKSDGTEDGTTLLMDIAPGPDSSDCSDLTTFKGQVYFAANRATEGAELWRTDGTTEGTSLYADVEPGATGSSPRQLTLSGARLYFTAQTIDHGEELWVTGGGASGARLVKDISSGVNSSAPHSLTDANGILYFVANDGVSGEELWMTDGSEAGTVLVRDIQTNPDATGPEWLTYSAPWLYFTASNDEFGNELWKTDGTVAGTGMVQDILAGAESGNPMNLIGVEGSVLFVANDGINGSELWKSDGTLEGTVRVLDVLPGFYDGISLEGAPTEMVRSGDYLYFVGRDPNPASYDSSRELFAYSIVDLLDAIAPIPTIELAERDGGAMILDIDFGQEVRVFRASELELANAMIESFADLGGGRYRVNLNALEDGIVTVSIPAGVARDLGGNLNEASQVFSIDTTPPIPPPAGWILR